MGYVILDARLWSMRIHDVRPTCRMGDARYLVNARVPGCIVLAGVAVDVWLGFTCLVSLLTSFTQLLGHHEQL